MSSDGSEFTHCIHSFHFSLTGMSVAYDGGKKKKKTNQIILRSDVVNGLTPRLPSLSQILIVLTHRYVCSKDESICKVD